MKIRTVPRSATVAWCPEETDVSILASGTFAGTMSDTFDPTGTLEFFAMDFSKNELEVMASLKTEEKLNRLAWASEMTIQSETYNLGILAGAMDSGRINLWNPSRILDQSEGKDVLFASAEKHSGAVKGLDFNRFQSNLLASGGLHGEVYIWDLSSIQPYAPGNQKSPSGDSDITDIGWNSQVIHILATSTANGMAVVWDLRAKRAVLSVKDSHSPSCSAMAWSPTESTLLVTACDDPNYPVIQTWDLRNTFTPQKTLQGHNSGILSLSWSRADPRLLLSSAKDNRTLCWDISKGEVIGELDTTQEGWTFDVKWAPTLPAIVSTCSLAGKIEIHSVQDLKVLNSTSDTSLFNKPGQKAEKQKLPPPPQWLKRPASVAFGFGGKLLYINKQNINESKPAPLTICTVQTDAEFVAKAENLQAVVKQHKFKDFCDEKTSTCKNAEEKSVWEFLKGLFQSDARSEVLNHLGFDREQLQKEIAQFSATVDDSSETKEESSTESSSSSSSSSTTTETISPPLSSPSTSSETSVDSLFGDSPATSSQDIDFASLGQQQPPSRKVVKKLSTSQGNLQKSSASSSSPSQPVVFSTSDPTEVMITKALLVGNFNGAVDCCFKGGRYADALVLAAFGNKNLLLETQARYLGIQKSPFMHMVSLIVKKEFEELVRNSDVKNWREVLAILCTYADSSKFISLSDLLGDRLSESNKDAALLCYICAAQIEKAIDIWVGAGVEGNEELQDLIEKVTIFGHAVNQKVAGPKMVKFYSRYAEKLASQGSLAIAHQFIQSLGTIEKIRQQDQSVASLYQRLDISLGHASSSSSSSSSSSTPSPGVVEQKPTQPIKPVASAFHPVQTSHQHTTQPVASPSSFQPTSRGGVAPPPRVGQSVFTPPVPTFPPVTPTTTTTTTTQTFLPPPPTSLAVPTPPLAPSSLTTTSTPGIYQPPKPGAVIHNTFVPNPQVTSTSIPTSPKPAAPRTVVQRGAYAPPVTQPVSSPQKISVAPPSFASNLDITPPPPVANKPVQSQEVAPPPPSSAPRARHHTELPEEQTPFDTTPIISGLLGLMESYKQYNLQSEMEDVSTRLHGELIPHLEGNTISDRKAVLSLDAFVKYLLSWDTANANIRYQELASQHFQQIGSKSMIGLKKLYSSAIQIQQSAQQQHL
eukprot:TRINITY_DN292_c0_g2_i1.p1 TRINITY_DN292_c0_g2~~TRINITY_DN292_c0_g2_i1.p1  ORF type:complete len:1154 (+),score=395.81 TRINITY_DN292_c0_g2_i1:46-3507(+)